jgi:hypothetical protein
MVGAMNKREAACDLLRDLTLGLEEGVDEGSDDAALGRHDQHSQ